MRFIVLIKSIFIMLKKAYFFHWFFGWFQQLFDYLENSFELGIVFIFHCFDLFSQLLMG